ncbi:hypothetical protein C8J56DRAFT_1051500 [Mycena floridula]|nr:hypothetical protein C8J56DRAFT_1051500 [Mycena floridula]
MDIFCDEGHPGCLKEYFILGSLTPKAGIILCDCGCNYQLKRLPEPISLQHSRRSYTVADDEVLCSYLVEAQESLVQCDEELSRLEELKEKITYEKKRITRSIAFHESMKASIRRLPPEILCIIFSFYCDIASGTPRSSRNDEKPWKCLSSLALYRLVHPFALDNSDAGGVDVNWPGEEDDDFVFSDDILGLVLQRSGQLPLKLWIDEVQREDDKFDNDSEMPWPYYDHLASVCRRIQHLHVSGFVDSFNKNSVFSALSAIEIHGDAEMLRWEDFGGRYHYDDREAPYFYIRFPWIASATRLHQLFLRHTTSSTTVDFSLFLKAIPAGNVQAVIIDDCDVSSASSILAELPKISSIQLLLDQDRTPSDLSDEPFSLTHLDLFIMDVDLESEHSERIVASHANPRMATVPLDALVVTTPSATAIITNPPRSVDALTTTWNYSIEWPLQAFADFLGRSNISDKLTSLSLAGINISSRDLIQTLELTPQLTSLTISCTDGKPIVTTDVLHQLSARPHSLLPLLTSLDIFIHDGIGSALAASRLIQQRTPTILTEGAANLKEIRLRVDSESNESFEMFSDHIDAESIHTFFGDARSELLRCDDEISRIQGLVTGITAQKSQIEACWKDVSRESSKDERQTEIILCNDYNHRFIIIPEPFSALDRTLLSSDAQNELMLR